MPASRITGQARHGRAPPERSGARGPRERRRWGSGGAKPPGLVDAFERFLKLEKRLLSFQLSPHADRPANQPALFLEAIVFDHPLDAGEPIVCAAMRN